MRPAEEKRPNVAAVSAMSFALDTFSDSTGVSFPGLYGLGMG
jgi:hypothetical protein